MTNKEYAKTNTVFKVACVKVKIKATARQASKWRRGRGKAYNAR